NINPVVTQKVALDNALVAPEKRLNIERCNARIEFSKPQNKATYQVTLDTLILTPCYLAFLELGYSRKCDMLSAIHTDQMHQQWRTFADIINRCISRKTTRLDRLKESRAQILWGMYSLKNVDYVALLWEDFMYQADNRDISPARKEHKPYPRFTKFVSKTEDYHKYGAVIPDGMINQDIKASKAYKTYHDFATGKVAPKKARKFKKVASPSKKLSPILEEEPVKKPKKAKKPAKKSTIVPTTSVVVRDTPGVFVSKKKAPTKGDRGKGMELLSDAALLKAAQVKEALQKSKKDSHILHASGSGDSEDDDSNDDVSDDVSKGDDDDADSDGDSDNDASDNERTDSDEEENPNLTLKDDEEEETQDDEYVHTSDSYASADEETNDDYREFDEEEYDELYKDVNVTSNVAEHAKEGKGDTEMTDAFQKDVS
ncbi:hypothetical protein Tco_1066032, partial [Tanacetum coccineum]